MLTIYPIKNNFTDLILSKTIIKAQELKLLQDTNELCQNLKQELLQDAERCREESYKEGLNQAHAENNKLYAELSTKLNTLFQELEVEITNLSYRILQKFGINNIQVNNLRTLIQQELSKTKLTPSFIQVQANWQTISKLQQEFAGDKLIEYKVNDELIDEECIYSTDIYIFRVNIDSAKRQIYQILQGDYHAFKLANNPQSDESSLA